MKVCSKCHIEKDESEFQLYNDYYKGKRYVCRRGYCFDCRKPMEEKYNTTNNKRKRIKYQPIKEANKKDREHKRQLKINSKTKICARCRVEQNKSEFQKAKKNVDGYGSYCKNCEKEEFKTKYRMDIDKSRELSRIRAIKFYHKNIEKLREKNRAWKNNNKEKYIELKSKADKKYYERQHEKISDVYLVGVLRQAGYTKEDIEKTPVIMDKKKLDIIIYRANKLINQKNKNHGNKKQKLN